MDKLIKQHYQGDYKLYPFGSFAYGTNRKGSDRDFIAVLDSNKYPKEGSTLNKDDITIHLFTKNDWKFAVEDHDVRALECLFLIDKIDDFEINLSKIRRSFSTVANGAWVKGKKKLLVSADYNKLLAVKSIFHSIRIFDYGLQIINNGNISEPSRYKWILTDLLRMSELYERNELWEKIESKYNALYKDLHSKFKRSAPKGLNKSKNSQSKSDLIEWLEARIKKKQQNYDKEEILQKKISIGSKLKELKILINHIHRNLIEI